MVSKLLRESFPSSLPVLQLSLSFQVSLTSPSPCSFVPVDEKHPAVPSLLILGTVPCGSSISSWLLSSVNVQSISPERIIQLVVCSLIPTEISPCCFSLSHQALPSPCPLLPSGFSQQGHCMVGSGDLLVLVAFSVFHTFCGSSFYKVAGPWASIVGPFHFAFHCC